MGAHKGESRPMYRPPYPPQTFGRVEGGLPTTRKPRRRRGRCVQELPAPGQWRRGTTTLREQRTVGPPMNRRRAAERVAVLEPARQQRCSREIQGFGTRERERDVRRG